jgi:uncharacterized membrane-anchored protein YjiN (DUF445 family)
VDQLQLKIRESKEENSRLELQKIKLQNFVKNFQDNNIEYKTVKQAIEALFEYILADRRQLVRTAVQSVIELLRADPLKFHSFYYNKSMMQSENNEEPLLEEAEQLYEKMLENMTNKAVTSLSDDTSSMSVFAQKGLCKEQAFHPNFDRIENNTNNIANNQIS